MSVDEARAQQTPIIGNLGQPEPVIHPENGQWRPQSTRVGIGTARYVWWNSFYTLLEFFNRKLARNPNRKVSWDKWPRYLGLIYLIAKIRFNRSNALTDPYDYMTTDDDPVSPQPDVAISSIAPDGKWVSDDRNGQMGASMTRYSSNIAPRRVRPDTEAITPSARTVSKRLRWRRLNDEGQEIVQRASILNVMAQAWIQFQFHGFGGNTLHDPVDEQPYRIPRKAYEAWPNDEAVIDRTAKDPTRVGYDDRPTPINEKVHAWVQGQLYGNNQAELERLRTFAGGKLALDPEGYLPEDPARPGVDLTGYSNNYSPFLSFLHWLFTKEHNAIADYLHAFHPDYSDEMLFQLARKTNCAQIARIHTIEWTEDLLQHPTLQVAMHGDWYGFLGQRLKLYLIRLCHRRPAVARLLKPLRDNDIIWGMPGSKWEHHDGPFQVPKHFRMVYRLHEMVLSTNHIFDPDNGRQLAQIDLLDFIHDKTRALVRKFGYATLGWSFLSEPCGALELHNFPRNFAQFHRMQDRNLIDLAELDIFREREDGTGSYNDLRRSLGEPAVKSFLELTGGDAELAKEIEGVYEGNISNVDAGIGILAEPKPKGFALGFVQFYQFVLNAPRRVKSNRFLSEGYNYDEYKEGLNWVEHGGGFKGAIRRHLPELEKRLEGVKRGFAPWPDAENFPERLLEESQDDNVKALVADSRTIILLSTTGWLGSHFELSSSRFLIPALILLGVWAFAIAAVRSTARRLLQNCEKKCNTDRRHFMFGTLYRAESHIDKASTAGKAWALTVIVLCLVLATIAWPRNGWIAILYLICGGSAISTIKWSNISTATARLLKVAIRSRMRAGRAVSASDNRLSSADELALDQLLRKYAPGRQYFTAYDFARMNEAERSTIFSAHLNSTLKRLLIDHADLIVEEDRKFVPAVSRATCARALSGLVQADVVHERDAAARFAS